MLPEASYHQRSKARVSSVASKLIAVLFNIAWLSDFVSMHASVLVDLTRKKTTRETEGKVFFSLAF